MIINMPSKCIEGDIIHWGSWCTVGVKDVAITEADGAQNVHMQFQCPIFSCITSAHDKLERLEAQQAKVYGYLSNHYVIHIMRRILVGNIDGRCQ